VESIDLNAKHWGVRMGIEAAEAFKVVRLIK
jgi:hypothetical protein